MNDCKTFTTQTFTTSDVHHPQCKIRRSPPQTFTTPSVKSDVHHPRRSPPQTFTTPCVKSDVHHPRRSPPQTFTTSDVHHPRHSPPQTFTTPSVKSDVHHPRLSPPQPSLRPTQVLTCSSNNTEILLRDCISVNVLHIKDISEKILYIKERNLTMKIRGSKGQG